MPSVNAAVSDRQRRRRHAARDDRTLDQHVGDQRAGGDLSLGPQAVVERHPRREQHQARRPHRGLARRDSGPEPGQHFAGQQEPAHDSAHQVGQPDPDARVADAGHQRQQVVVPAERVLGTAEPAEVVRHVAGVPGDAGHLQDVAVVRRVGADDMPHQEAADHDDVGARRTCASAGEATAASGGRRAGPAATARPARRSSQMMASTIAASFKAVGLVENRVSITADALRPGGAGPVRSVKMPTIAGRRFGSGKPVRCSEPVGGVGQPDEGGEGAGLRRGDLDSLTAGRNHTLPRHAGHHDVAVGDVDALAG